MPIPPIQPEVEITSILHFAERLDDPSLRDQPIVLARSRQEAVVIQKAGFPRTVATRLRMDDYHWRRDAQTAELLRVMDRLALAETPAIIVVANAEGSEWTRFIEYRFNLLYPGRTSIFAAMLPIPGRHLTAGSIAKKLGFPALAECLKAALPVQEAHPTIRMWKGREDEIRAKRLRLNPLTYNNVRNPMPGGHFDGFVDVDLDGEPLTLDEPDFILVYSWSDGRIATGYELSARVPGIDQVCRANLILHADGREEVIIIPSRSAPEREWFRRPSREVTLMRKDQLPLPYKDEWPDPFVPGISYARSLPGVPEPGAAVYKVGWGLTFLNLTGFENTGKVTVTYGGKRKRVDAERRADGSIQTAPCLRVWIGNPPNGMPNDTRASVHRKADGSEYLLVWELPLGFGTVTRITILA